MVVNRDRESFLRFLLADDVIVEVSFDVDRTRNFQRRFRDLFALALFRNDVIAELDTLVTDVNAGARDQFLNFVLALTAEAAAKKARRRFFFIHIRVSFVLAA